MFFDNPRPDIFVPTAQRNKSSRYQNTPKTPVGEGGQTTYPSSSLMFSYLNLYLCHHSSRPSQRQVGGHLDSPDYPASARHAGRANVYLANARASAFLQLTFWLPNEAVDGDGDCTVDVLGLRSAHDSLIRQKASHIRMVASR